MGPSLQSKTARPRAGDRAVQKNTQTTLDWAVLDWGMADWITLMQSGLEITRANYVGRANLAWVDWK